MALLDDGSGQWREETAVLMMTAAAYGDEDVVCARESHRGNDVGSAGAVAINPCRRSTAPFQILRTIS